MRLLRVATCNLNQWAMDFDTNLRNVKESIARAKTAGAVARIGPELELTGYRCEDHFLEQDTTAHAWECLKDILSGDYTDNILCCIGMPVIFKCTVQLPDELVDYQLPIDISEAISQETVPFGYGYIQFLDVLILSRRPYLRVERWRKRSGGDMEGRSGGTSS